MTAAAAARADGRLALLLTLAAIAAGAALRFTGLDWDKGLMLHPDEANLVRGATYLNMQWGEDPHFYAYGGLALFAPRVVTAFWSIFDPTLDVLAPHVLSAAARWISAWCSLGVVALGPLIMRRAGAGATAGAAVAWLLALDVGLIQAAHFGTTDAPLVFVLALLVHLGIGLTSGRIRTAKWVLLSGAVLGAGLALKISAAPMALVPATAALLQARRIGLLWLPVAALGGAVVTVAVFSAFNPHAYIYWHDFTSIMDFEAGVVSGRNDVFWTLQFLGQPPFFLIAQMPWMSGPLLPGLGIAGILALLLAAWRKAAVPRALAPLALFALVWFVYIVGVHAAFIRYLLPLSLPLAIGAVWLIAELAGRWRAVAALGLILTSALWALAFTAIYRAEDSRIVASRWLVETAKPTDVLIFEPNDSPIPTGILNAPAYETRLMELREEGDRPEITLRFAEHLEEGDWIVMASRRSWMVLPRLRHRFPAACAYYAALFAGELGFQEVRQFANMPRLWGIVIPTTGAEETFEVFDHPTVRIFRKTRDLSRDELAAAMARYHWACTRPDA